MLRISCLSLLLCALLFIPVHAEETSMASEDAETVVSGSIELISADTVNNVQSIDNGRQLGPGRDQPSMTIEPIVIELEVFAGELVDVPVTIGNEGDEQLQFTVEFEVVGQPERGPRRDEPGELLAQFESPLSEVGGMAFDGELMWASSTSTNQMSAMTLDGEVVRTVDTNASPMSLGFDGELFWSTSWPGRTIYLYDLDINRVGQFDLPFTQHGGIGSDREEFMYINSMADRLVHIIRIDNHQEVGTIDYLAAMANADIGGIDWVPSHPGGQLWGNTQGRLYQVFVDENNNCQPIQDFAVRTDNRFIDPCHDGENVWHGMWGEGEQIYVYDDGIAEIRWISVDPEEGEIEPGEEADLSVILDAENIAVGEYSAEVTVFSNDPDNAEVVVEVLMTVVGTPNLRVEWDEDYGYPEVMDWNEGFQDVLPGRPYAILVELINTGIELLIIEDVLSDHDYFTANFEDEIEIEVGESAIVEFVFEAPENDPGDYNTVMVISSNTPEGENVIAMHAEATLPPIFVWDTDEIEDELQSGESNELTITIGNEGAGVFRWNTRIELLDNGDRDHASRNVRRIDSNDGPHRDEPGEQLYTFNLLHIRMSGFDWDPTENVMWVASYRPAWIHAYAYDGYGGIENVFDQQLNQSTMAMGFIDGIIYTNQWSESTIYRYDTDGNNLGNSNSDCPQIMNFGTSKDNGWLFAFSGVNRNIHVYDVNNNYERIGLIEGPQVYDQMDGEWSRVLCWVDAHPDGQLWLGTRERAWQFFVNTDTWQAELVQSFPTQSDNEWCAIGHDGDNLWRANSERNQGVRVYDDGIEEFCWVSCEPEEGELEAGNEEDILINLNATGLNADLYEADLTFFTNDPENPAVVISIMLGVIGEPRIEPEWEPGYPDVVEWNEAYPELFTGGGYPIEVTIMNVGTDVLEVVDITCENGVFTCEPAAFEVPASEEQIVNFILFAEDAGEHEGVMVIISNDPDEVFEIQLSGETLPTPRIEVDPQEIIADMMEGDIDEHVIHISNIGESELHWWVDTEIIAEPERDQRSRRARNASGYSGPRRDEVDLSGMMFAVLQDVQAWNWLDERMMEPDPLLTRNGDDANYVTFRDGNAWNEIEFEEYDAIVYAGNRQSEDYNNAFNQNLERFTEYIDDGGAAYTETADRNPPIRLPGGFNNNGGGSPVGRLAVSPDPDAGNYSVFAEICHESQPDYWDLGEMIEGDDWVNSSYDQGQFQQALDNREIEWFQTIAIPSGYQTAGAIAYGIGRGTVLAVCHPIGDCWTNWTQPGQWGSIASEILYYLTEMSRDKWLTCEPEEGRIEPDGAEDITVNLNTEGLSNGLYEAELYIYSNDPVQIDDVPDVIIAVTMEVIGRPIIEVDHGGPGPIDFGIVYIDYPDTLLTTLSNIGSEVLTVEDFESENDAFSISDEVEFPFNVPVEGSVNLPLVFDPIEEAVNLEGIIWIFTNDLGWEDGYPVWVSGDGLVAPEIAIEPDRLDEEIGDEMEEFVFNISNNGGSDLQWDTEFEVISEPEEDRDRTGRSVRRVRDQVYAPRRDLDSRGILIAQRCGWNHDFELYFRAIEDFEYDRFQTWDQVQDVEFTDYDIMWIGNYESEAWVGQYNQNLDRIEEFVGNGGVLYHSSGTIRHGTRPVNPGGLVYSWGQIDGWRPQNQCPLTLNPEQNFFINYMNENDPYGWEWREGQRLVGNGCANGVFTQENINNMENVEWVEIMAMGNPVNEPIIITYKYGQGYVLASTTTDGLLHNQPDQYQWGRAGVGILHYLDFLANIVSWFDLEPNNGVLEPDGNVNVTATVDPEGLPDGIYESVLRISSNDPETPVLGVPIVLTFGVVEQPDVRIVTLELAESWNMISINVDPTQFYAENEDRGPDVIMMFEGLRIDDDSHRIVLLKNEGGQFWAPGFNFINIAFWNLTEGYQMNMTEAIDYEIEGIPIPADSDVPLEPHWNLIAYFPTYDLDARAPDFYVLEGIVDRVFLAKDRDGRFISPEFNFSNMNPWTQGQGYQIKILGEDDIVFNYPPEQEELAFIENHKSSEAGVYPVTTSHNMSVLINSILGVEPGEGDMITAYASSGMKIGSGGFTGDRCGLAVWGDEEGTEIIEGALRDEAITLKFWDADQEIERDINVMAVLEGKGLTFESNGFLALDVKIQSAVPVDYYLSQNYPNPFNSTTRLTYGSPENADISVNVFDMNGRLIKELVSGVVTAGNHTVSWDASNVAAGIYLVKMEASTGFKSVVKVMLVK